MSQIFGGSSGGSSITLETNGVPNAVQTLLNLIAGGNITLTADAFGGVTITASVSNVPVIVQSTENSSGSAPSLAKAFTSGNVAGNATIIIAQWKSASVTMAVADSNLNSYGSIQGPNPNGADPLSQQVWLATNIAAGANTVTITPSANVEMMLIIIEIENLAALSTFDQSNWNDSVTPTTGMTSGNITTTQNVELLIAYGGTESQAATITPEVTWNLLQNTDDVANAQAFFAQYLVVTSENTYSSTATISAGSPPAGSTWGMGIISLRAAISSTSPNAAIVSFTTVSLANGATQNGTVSMAKTFALLHVSVTQAARLRLYSTAAARTADASRPNSVPPTPGTQHGVLCDLYLDTADKYSWTMAPIALGFNWDATQSTTIYYALTNLGSTAAITATMTYVPMES